MSENVFACRRDKMFALLAEQDLEFAVFGEPLTFFYLTGRMIQPMERFLALVMDVGTHMCTAIVPTAEVETLSGTGLDIRPIRDQESPVEVLASYIRPGSRLGVQMGGGYNMIYSMALGRQLFERFGMDLTDVTGLAEQMRLIKDSEEIRLMQINADITDQALELAKKELIHPGTKDTEISMHIYQSFWRAQAKPDMTPGVLVGPISALPHGGACGQQIQEQDVVLIDFGSCFGYYNADMTRTFFVGEPDPKLRKVYQIVLEAHLAAIAAAKPGVPCGLVDKAARDVITQAGYGQYFTHRVGHGLGLAVHEAPSMHGENQTLIQEGMVFTVEPGIYIPGLGGIRIEDDVYIKDGAAHSFNHFPKDLESMILRG